MCMRSLYIHCGLCCDVPPPPPSPRMATNMTSFPGYVAAYSMDPADNSIHAKWQVNTFETLLPNFLLAYSSYKARI